MVALDSPPVAEVSSDNPLNTLILDSIQGKGYPVRDWLTSYPLLMVALDPYTHESAWILETASQFLHHYTPADIRVAWLVAADDAGCRAFLGPWADKYLTFADPDRTAILGLGLQTLPVARACPKRWFHPGGKRLGPNGVASRGRSAFDPPFLDPAHDPQTG